MEAEAALSRPNRGVKRRREPPAGACRKTPLCLRLAGGVKEATAPTSLGRKNVERSAPVRPVFASAHSKLARCEALTRSQAIAMPNPAAAATPSTAAILEISRSHRCLGALRRARQHRLLPRWQARRSLGPFGPARGRMHERPRARPPERETAPTTGGSLPLVERASTRGPSLLRWYRRRALRGRSRTSVSTRPPPLARTRRQAKRALPRRADMPMPRRRGCVFPDVPT